MADDGRWLVREITDIVATTHQLRYRRATGEQIPWHEQVELHHRKIRVLRALAERSPRDRGVFDALGVAEHSPQQTTPPASRPEVRHSRDLGATS